VKGDKGALMVTMTESRRGARMRAAVDRLHAAQLAALEESGAPVTPARPGDDPAVRRDAYREERQVLAHLGEMGSLLVRLGGPAQADTESAQTRRRVVSLSVACANGLAELVSLAFEVERVGETRGKVGEAEGSEAGQGAGGEPGVLASAPREAEGGGGEGGGQRGSNGASAPARLITSMRAVTDTNRLLVDQLRRLMQNAARQESWRTARPGELWKGLLLQVAELLPLVAALEAGGLSEAEGKEVSRLTADAGNYLAFLRCFPRAPTA
jgi:hypothetical protein